MEIKLKVKSKALTPAQKVAILGKVEEIKKIIQGDPAPKPAPRGVALDVFLECHI